METRIVQVVNISLGKLAFFQAAWLEVNNESRVHRHTCATLQRENGRLYIFAGGTVRLQPPTITLYFDNSARKLCRRSSENVLPPWLINRR